MEQKLPQEKLDLINNEIQKFQRIQENSSIVNEGVATILVDKLINILQHGQVQTEEEDNSTFETESNADQKAMTNSVVVREILRHMDTRTLLNLRGVSRLWREEATSHLLSPRHENDLTVKFKWVDCYGHFGRKESILPEFMDNVIKYSQIFPCSQFSFHDGRLTDTGLVQFFSNFGSHVQQLTLSTEYIEVKTLRNILFKWTPNLKSLTLSSNRWTTLPSSSSSSSDHLLEKFPSQNRVLNKLKKITLPTIGRLQTTHGRNSILEILTCAPNLTCIEDPTLAYLPQIAEAGTFSLVKSLTWNFLDSSYLMQNFINFAAGDPRLTSLILEEITQPSVDSRFISAVHSLFQLGQNTLEIVKGIHILGTLPNPAIKIPPLPKVTEIQFSTYLMSDPYILPQDYALSKILPNLKSIQVEAWHHIYPFISPLNAHSSLRKLKLSNFVSKLERTRENCFQPAWLQALGPLYPNITHLHIVIHKLGVRRLPECLTIIPGCFKELEEIVIEIRTEDNFHDLIKIRMDLALTGLPWEVYDRLQSNFEPEPEFQQIEVLERTRTQSSILDLKKLTNLTFDVHFGGTLKPMWSHVTQFYAFQPMAKRQGLVVNIRGTQSAQLTGNDLGPL